MNSCFLFIWPISLMLMTSRTACRGEHRHRVAFMTVVGFRKTLRVEAPRLQNLTQNTPLPNWMAMANEKASFSSDT